MLDLILDTARRDERIRAVILNGSRANPEGRRDIFQDFDIVYLVTDVEAFKADRDWPKRFGEIMVMQLPEDIQDPSPAGDGGFAYLMQFMDGNRIDLSLYPIESALEHTNDSLSVVLLDKDGLLPQLAPASERDYLPKPPTEKQFADCCNEFWWCAPYVAKGLWRRQISYAKHMLDGVLRDQLMKMLAWYVGIQTGFKRNPGYLGKYLQEYLAPELWSMLLATYSDADSEHTWDALEVMCELFRHAATAVAQQSGFEYPSGDDARVTAHLQHVRLLPQDASEIY